MSKRYEHFMSSPIGLKVSYDTSKEIVLNTEFSKRQADAKRTSVSIGLNALTEEAVVGTEHFDMCHMDYCKVDARFKFAECVGALS